MLQELIFAVNVADVAVRFIFEVLLKPHQINYVNLIKFMKHLFTTIVLQFVYEFSLVTIT